MSLNNTKFTLEQIIDYVTTWVTTGTLNPGIIGDNFEFNSPHWGHANKTQFLEKFLDTTEYIQKSLSLTTKFDQVTKFKSTTDDRHFAIIFCYWTKNGHNPWEAVLGEVQDGKLISLRSIYDFNEDKEAHDSWGQST